MTCPVSTATWKRTAVESHFADAIYVLRQHLTPDGKGGQRITYYRAGATEASQRITLGAGVTAGSFTLNGVTIPYNATRFQLWNLLKSAFADIPRYGPSFRTTGGPLPATPIDVIFTGQKSGVAVDLMTANSAGLTGGTASISSLSSAVAAIFSPCWINLGSAGFERIIGEKLASVSSEVLSVSVGLLLIESDRLEISDGSRVLEVKGFATGGVTAAKQIVGCDEVK